KGKKEEREKESTRLYESEKANLKHARATLKKREWLEDAQVHFNKKGNLYDFDGYTIQKGTVEIKELSDKIDKLERCLCMKNVSNLDVIEAKVQL
uniref:Uncharacterized protein n=1 Tax=Caenorhabditis japonica TaxID=281687 RepID=A0A8R1IL58_CAEJA